MSIFKLPHLVFIESACPAFLTKYMDADVYIYSKNAHQYGQKIKKSIVVSNEIIKYLKVIAAVLRFPCTFQGGYGIAFNISNTKSIISDGLLTEWLYKNKHIKPKKFISIKEINPFVKSTKNTSLIIGSNWCEFGTLKEKNYEKLLIALEKLYQNASYFPHPKEDKTIAKKIFGNRLINSSIGVEAHCIQEGIPERIIGPGSTALVTLARMSLDPISIEVLRIDPDYCDGIHGDCTDPHLKESRNITIKLEDLTGIALEMIEELNNIKILTKEIRTI